MSLSSIAPPAVEPVSLVEVKAQLRLTATDEDALVTTLIAAAVRAVEAATDTALITRRMRLSLDAWPGDGIVAMPVGPVRSVEAIRVFDANGVAAAVDASPVRIDQSALRPRLLISGPRPSPGLPLGGIEIDHTVGFGASAAAVPDPLRLAVRMLAVRWFERRGDDEPGRGPIAADVAALLAPFRSPRLA